MAQLGTQQLGTVQLNGSGVDPSPVIDVPTATLTLTGFPPEIAEIPIPTGALTLTGIAPNPFLGFSIDIPTGTLTLAGIAPAPVIGFNFNVPTGTLTLTGFAPIHKEAPVVEIPTGALTLTGQPGPTFKYIVRLDMVYNLRQRFTHDMNYSLLAPVQATHDINYDLQVGNPLQKTFDISYGLPFKVEHDMVYALNTTLKVVHDIAYGLLTNVTALHDMPYDILSVDPVRRTYDMRYSLLQSSVIDVSGVMEITIPGRAQPIGVRSARVFKDETDAHWTCSISLTDINDYALFVQDDPFTLSLFGEEWEFLVDAKELSRNDPGSWDAKLQGISPTANDDFPRVDQYTQEFPNDITARTAVEGALSIAVEWRDFVDWIIPGGRLSADRASPLDFATTIVEAAGGILEAKKDGTWLVRHKYPVSPQWYDTTTPDNVFNEQDKIFQATEQFVPGQVVNRIRITDGDANFNDIVEFEPDENNALQGELFIYPGPFRTTVELLTTALPADITLSATSPQVQQREVTDLVDEERGVLVEFVNCEATVQYPIYGITEVEWVGIDLGAVTFEEGSTTLNVSGSQGYSMARIKYTTQYLRYTVLASQPIDAQFILEDVG